MATTPQPAPDFRIITKDELYVKKTAEAKASGAFILSGTMIGSDRGDCDDLRSRLSSAMQAKCFV